MVGWSRLAEKKPSARAVVYRKVLLATRGTRAVVEVAVASTVMALLGFALYWFVYPSGVILFEALVWSVEAMAFTGVALALRVAGSRALFYRARYEIFRAEALAVSILSAVGIVVTLWIMVKAVSGGKGETPILLASYPLGSAVASLVLEKRLLGRAESLRLRLVSVRAVASKLRYDVAVEAAGGLAIIVSNLLGDPLAETLLVLAVGAYVLYGLSSLLVEHLHYLIGPGPGGRRREIRASIRDVARRSGYRVVKVRPEIYGTFGEAEVWVEMDPDIRLADAHRSALELAHRLVSRIPDLLRVIIIPVPARNGQNGHPHQGKDRRRRLPSRSHREGRRRQGEESRGEA